MKIYSKLLMMLTVVLAFTACSDDDDYEKGPEAGSYNVTFADGSSKTLQLTDTSFDVTLTRTNPSGELTVPLEIVEAASVFSGVPTSVTFPSGQSEVTFSVNIASDADAFVDYPLHLRIPQEYTNPYVEQSTYPEYLVYVHKEDYKPFAIATYTSWFFDGESWDVDIYYSEYLGLYRINDLFVEGYHFYYKLDDKGNLTITNSSGSRTTSKIESGYVHPTYGMVSATWLPSNFTGYDPDDDAYYIPFQWTVSAGSFGAGYDSFQISFHFQ